MGQRDRRHLGASRRRRWIWWLPLVVVLLVPLLGAAVLELGDRTNPLPFPVPGLPGDGPAAQLALPDVTFPADPGAAVPASVRPGKVRAALASYLHAKGLDGQLHVAVGGLDGGPVYTRDDVAMMPASTMKLLTTTTALHLLGPDHRFHTTVTRPNARTVVLVGGGDPYLEAKPRPGAFPARADLRTLAAQVAAAVGHRRVRLGFDDTLFTGPAVSPAWPATYVPENVVAPISALWVGRGWTARGVSADPAMVAAEAFRTALTEAGVRTIGVPTRLPGHGPVIADVASAPLADIVESTLTHSDNEAAEVLARQAALATGRPASFVGGADTVRATIEQLGISLAGARIHDGSGLSRRDRLTASILLSVLRLDAGGDPDLRPVITGLPVGGFSGSLSDRFAKTPKAADGLIRAKTGTLTGASGLAGIVLEQGRTPVAFVVLADHLPALDTTDARAALDRLAAALALCTCH